MADKKEVEIIEKVEVEPTEDTELIDEEKETPDEEEDVKETEDEEPEKEDPKPDEEPPVDKPKPVEGETPRERALRLEVQRLKKDRRKDRASELIDETPKPIEKVEEDLKDDALAKYDQTELKNLEEVVDVIAKKKGWMRKEDQQASQYQEKAADILDDWIEDHEEYSPENDPDDVLWDRFKAEFNQYKKPENPKDLKRIFNRVHKEVFGIEKSGDSSVINAQKEKLKSHSGTTQTVRKQSPSSIDSTHRNMLKGFDDKELDELFEE